MASARGIVIEIIGDATSYLRAADQTIASNTKLDESYKAVGVNAQLSADASVKAAIKASEAQRAHALAVQSTVSKLPLEQQAAGQALANAEMAKYNRTIGVTTTSTRALSSASKDGEKDIGKLVRGTLAGSGAVSGFGRSLAFASSGFLAFAAGATILVKSVSSADDLEKAQNSLSVAIEHTRGSVQQLLPQYEATAKAAEKFGVNETDATAALAQATVLTGNASAAQRAYQEALVISKALGKDFNAALTATAKGQEGVTTSLKRYGLIIGKNETGTEQFTQVMNRFGGQAAANTTSIDQLHAALSNTLDTIGVALLPTVNKLAASFAVWLTNMNDSGKLQKDVASGMKTIHDVLTPVVSTFKAADAAAKGFAGGLKSIYDAARGVNSAVGNAFHSVGGLFGIGGGSSSSVQLQSALVRPSAFVPGGLTEPRGPAVAQGPFGAAQRQSQFDLKFALTNREQLAQAQASITPGTADDVAAAHQVINRIKQLLDQGRLHGQALIQALGLEATAVNTLQSAQAAAAQKAAAAAAAAKAKLQAQIQNSIDPLKLEVQLSKDQADNAKRGKIIADLKALRESARQALASGDLSLQQQKQAYDQITQLNQQIAALNKKQQQAAKDAYREVNTRQVTAGLGLTPEQRRELRARLSQLGPGHTRPGDGTGAEGFDIGSNGRPIHIHTHVEIDKKQIGTAVTKVQQRRRRRNSSQSRGPNAGGG